MEESNIKCFVGKIRCVLVSCSECSLRLNIFLVIGSFKYTTDFGCSFARSTVGSSGVYGGEKARTKLRTRDKLPKMKSR
jgi:hypothetical protein